MIPAFVVSMHGKRISSSLPALPHHVRSKTRLDLGAHDEHVPNGYYWDLIACSKDLMKISYLISLMWLIWGIQIFYLSLHLHVVWCMAGEACATRDPVPHQSINSSLPYLACLLSVANINHLSGQICSMIGLADPGLAILVLKVLKAADVIVLTCLWWAYAGQFLWKLSYLRDDDPSKGWVAGLQLKTSSRTRNHSESPCLLSCMLTGLLWHGSQTIIVDNQVWQHRFKVLIFLYFDSKSDLKCVTQISISVPPMRTTLERYGCHLLSLCLAHFRSLTRFDKRYAYHVAV